MIQQFEEKRGRKTSYADAEQKELAEKDEFETQIAICSGEKEATKEEYKKMVYALFHNIIAYRQGNRINPFFVYILFIYSRNFAPSDATDKGNREH